MTTDEFFATGLTHYGTAVTTVEDFKDAAFKRLERVVADHSWNRLVLAADWRSTCAHYQKVTDVYVSIGVACQFDGAACQLELGLWWGRDNAPGVELYVGLQGDATTRWRTSMKPQRPGTTLDVGGTAYLVRPVGAAAFDADATAILDEREEAARTAKGGA